MLFKQVTRRVTKWKILVVFGGYSTQIRFIFSAGVRGGAAGRSRVRFPMVSLEFFIDIILLFALWPWGRLSL